ncbi:unnamed protein product [Camellia sinensis]
MSDGCSIWSEDLFNVEQLKDDDPDKSDFCLKLSASAFLSEDSRRKRRKWFILALAASMTLVLLYVEKDKVTKQRWEDLLLFDVGTSIGATNCTLNEANKDLIGGKKEVALSLFSFTSVSSATDNFSDAKKLREAGFGPIYKTSLLLLDTILHGQSITASNTIVPAGNDFELGFLAMNLDTILPGQSITDSDTIVSAGNVKLGFFSPGNRSSTINYYGGIWYKRISVQTVVWATNRDYPLTDSSAALSISADGNLTIVKGKFLYMLTNISSNGNTSATLLDSRNLVLRDRTSGKLQLLSWSETTRKWGLIWSQLSQQCKVYAYCGAFSICSQKALPFCQCLPGFEPPSVRNWIAGDVSRGCIRKAPLQCGNDSQANGQSDHDGCSIWSEDLFNVEQLKDDDPDRSDFYLKLSASAFLSEDSRRKRWKWFILALAVSMTLLTSTLFYCMLRRISHKTKDLISGKNEVALSLFSFTSVSSATDNFSDANKLGEAGFGPVYK